MENPLHTLGLELFVYKPNQAAPAPTTIEIKPDCSKLGSGKSMNQKVVKYNKYIRPGASGGRTKCQPDKMPTGQNANLGWHFVRDFFSMVGILSGPTFWLAFCPDHLKMSWHPPPPQPQRVGGSCNLFLFAVDCCGEKSR